MRTYYSTLDLECANIIFQNTELYTQEFIIWAIRVKRFFADFWNVVRTYCKRLSSRLALKAVWTNLRKGMSFAFMLRKVRELRQYKPSLNFSNTVNRQKDVQNIAPKTTKHNRRTSCSNKAARLQGDKVERLPELSYNGNELVEQLRLLYSFTFES